MSRTGIPRVVCRIALTVLALCVWLAPGVAAAHGEEEHKPSPTPTVEPTPEAEAPAPTPTHLELELPDDVRLGEVITVEAVLRDHRDRPIRGATISFVRSASLGEALPGELVIGTAVTDERGIASIQHEVRSSGEIHISAGYVGDETHRGVEAEHELMVFGDRQLYAPSTGIRVPWLNLWVLAGVIAVVWALYFVVGLRILAIAGLASGRHVGATADGGITRRQLFWRALPIGSQVGIAGMGVALVALVVRSPRTHGNLLTPPATERYSRTSVARLGAVTDMRPMPEPLTTPVSFRHDILPIFLAYGGPHVVQPRNSPPPGNLRLDAYEHVMAREGVVVPGKPQESELIEHLLSVGMQMPPSVRPMPDEQIRLIVSWIAQGAKDD